MFRVRSTSFRACYYEKEMRLSSSTRHTFFLTSYLCNFVMNRQDRIDARGRGAVALLKRSIRYHSISMPALQGIEVAEISLCTTYQGSVSVVAVYKSPWKLFPASDLDAILGSAPSTVLYGNLNRKHPVENSSIVNNNAKLFCSPNT
ncbi:hypothetical protein Zmor_004387 [Zophobas morio]|jgi:hypothetical protein|uniref:Uncharacterized protein n=1 Tax=Zophobas morio TaxID=2755281 RepID=A0AA38HKJ1_9CUCU|nr:hypothetical protein Zmor_004387 [Zophobas morio]